MISYCVLDTTGAKVTEYTDVNCPPTEITELMLNQKETIVAAEVCATSFRPTKIRFLVMEVPDNPLT